ncbi:PIN domain-containing protein [Nocardioides sp. NBC_00850]|uniref:PIN domain-containing protein n=1 Tax=Nocardioides sp. NBC_00850 TaxID=2976001 RepID=UPI003865A1BB|nr:PIN domain-containing protein [Nocardioides sp. NBC_00850]
MTLSVVLADANILYSRTLRDYFLYAADAGAIELHWSQEILDEMSRNLRAGLGIDTEHTDRLEQLMNAYLEYALVEISDEATNEVADVEMDAKDRHVLAAAVSAEADILLTDNIRHFPRAWMDGRGIELVGSGDLLIRLAESVPGKVRSAHDVTLRHSKKDESDLLATLARCVGDPAVAAIRRVLAGE